MAWWWFLRVLFGACGDYLIGDSINSRVQLCPASGSCSTVVDEVSVNYIFQPWGVAVTATGDYVICDIKNNEVLLCPSSGASACTTITSDGATHPLQAWTVVVDGNADLVIADRAGSRVQLCPADEDANCTTVAGTGESGSLADQLLRPKGIALDGAGDYVVVDTDNHRVQLCPAAVDQYSCTHSWWYRWVW